MLATLTLLLLAFLAIQPVCSAEFFCPSGDVTCLIASINEANRNGEDNTINLELGTYTLTTVDNNTQGPNGLPSITGRMTIQGQDMWETIIARDSGAPEFRMFHVAASGTLRLNRVAVKNGLYPLFISTPGRRRNI